MKLIILAAISTLFASANAEAATAEELDFHNEFFQGMESGFFLRDTPDAYKDYECPDLAVDTDKLKVIQAFFVPVQMVLNMLQIDSVTTILNGIEVFVSSILSLQATVRGYPGSEFCSGVLFGIHGSNLLLNVGKVVVVEFEKVQNEVKSKLKGLPQE